MTIQEFNNTGFTGGSKAIYQGKEYDIVSVDFGEALIAIDECDDINNPSWKRCENIEEVIT